MSSRINIMVDLADASLRERLALLLAGDWSTSWNLVDALRNPQASAVAPIAITDDELKAKSLDSKTLCIFVGTPESDKGLFDAIPPGQNAEGALFTAVKKAFSYKETIRQNIESLYPSTIAGEALKSVAHSISGKLADLRKLADMRLAIIEQMPAGVVGIDEEGTIVLANAEAIKLLGMEDTPVWGMDAGALFNAILPNFLSDTLKTSASFELYGQKLEVRKSPFLLENRPAGTILILSRPFASREGA